MIYFFVVFLIMAAATGFFMRETRRIPEAKVEDSDHLKLDLCRRAIRGGVCGYNCDSCAWYVELEGENDDQ